MIRMVQIDGKNYILTDDGKFYEQIAEYKSQAAPVQTLALPTLPSKARSERIYHHHDVLPTILELLKDGPKYRRLAFRELAKKMPGMTTSAANQAIGRAIKEGSVVQSHIKGIGNVVELHVRQTRTLPVLKEKKGKPHVDMASTFDAIGQIDRTDNGTFTHKALRDYLSAQGFNVAGLNRTLPALVMAGALEKIDDAGTYCVTLAFHGHADYASFKGRK